MALTSTSVALARPAPARQNRRRREPSARTSSPGASACSRRTTAARVVWHAMESMRCREA
jgi:hypothetical protein